MQGQAAASSTGTWYINDWHFWKGERSGAASVPDDTVVSAQGRIGLRQIEKFR